MSDEVARGATHNNQAKDVSTSEESTGDGKQQKIKKHCRCIRGIPDLTKRNRPQNGPCGGNNYRRRRDAHQRKQVTTIKAYGAVDEIARPQRHQMQVVV
jgi:hypothetical protein